MDTKQAKKLLKDYLDTHHIPYTSLTAKTVNFTDLARGESVFVTIHGFTPNPIANEIRSFAKDNNFCVEFA
ncbi:MAG: hypothetical protein KatS3mg002_1078 [Candidatus Woesearchaeota archaeon]|nr:MAG: hypothetical protein KatS3mg002_1078 [Candidatus Woesearchaeota archaeon]